MVCNYENANDELNETYLVHKLIESNDLIKTERMERLIFDHSYFIVECRVCTSHNADSGHGKKEQKERENPASCSFPPLPLPSHKGKILVCYIRYLSLYFSLEKEEGEGERERERSTTSPLFWGGGFL